MYYELYFSLTHCYIGCDVKVHWDADFASFISGCATVLTFILIGLKKIIEFNNFTRQLSLMIHSARPTVSPEVNIVLAWNLFCFALIWKMGKDGRTTCEKTMIITGRGSASWINKSSKYRDPPGLFNFIMRFCFVTVVQISCLNIQ